MEPPLAGRALYSSAGPAWRQTGASAPQVPRAVGVPASSGLGRWHSFPEVPGFSMEIVLGLTERLSAHLTGEDAEARGCQSLSESTQEPRRDS